MEYNKSIFAQNLDTYMTATKTTRADICALLGVGKSTVASWCNAEKIPRMDKIEKMANHFGIKKSDLIEQKENPQPKAEGELSEYLEYLRERPERKALLSVTKNATKEQIETAVKIVDAYLEGIGVYPMEDE